MKKNNNKGFTLVELIVVLVILAILAAILVPALLGYIDKARQGQYAEEAHSILTAVQAYETEQYAKGETSLVAWDADMKKYVNNIVSPTNVDSVTGLAPITDAKGAGSNSSTHKAMTVGSMTVTFTSQDGKKGTMSFDGSEWTIDSQFVKTN